MNRQIFSNIYREGLAVVKQHIERVRDRTSERGYRLQYAMLISVIILGFYFRIRNVGVSSLWVDEAITSVAAKNFINNQGFSNAVGPTSPYRRSWLTTTLPIALSFKIFGLSEFAARLPTVIYGTITIGVAYFVGNHYNRILALLFSAYIAFDPFIVVWSRIARMYAPLLLFYLLSIYIFIKWYDSSDLEIKSPYPLVLGILSLVGFHTHRAYLGLIASIGVFIILMSIYLIWKDKITSRSQLEGKARNLSIISAAMIVSSLPIWFVLDPLSLLPASPGNSAGIEYRYYWDFIRRTMPILSIILVPGCIYSVWKNESTGVFVIAFWFPFFVASAVPQKDARYIYHLYPLVGFIGLFFVIGILYTIWNKAVEGEKKIGLYEIATISVLILILMPPIAGYNVGNIGTDSPGDVQRSEWKEATKSFSQEIGEDDIIISTLPTVSVWYLDRTDYFFRQQFIGSYESVDGKRIHPRSGAIILNDTESIKTLLRESDKEIWLFAGNKHNRGYSSASAKSVVKNNFELKRSWENMKVYHYSSNSSTNLASPSSYHDNTEYLGSVKGNVYEIDNYLTLGRTVDEEATWGSQNSNQSGVLIVNYTASSNATIETRLYGNNQDRYVEVYVSSDGQSWTPIIRHRSGRWETYNISLSETELNGQLTHIRIVGGSEVSKNGGLVDYLRVVE